MPERKPPDWPARSAGGSGGPAAAPAGPRPGPAGWSARSPGHRRPAPWRRAHRAARAGDPRCNVQPRGRGAGWPPDAGGRKSRRSRRVLAASSSSPLIVGQRGCAAGWKVVWRCDGIKAFPQAPKELIRSEGTFGVKREARHHGFRDGGLRYDCRGETSRSDAIRPDHVRCCRRAAGSSRPPPGPASAGCGGSAPRRSSPSARGYTGR